jgi:hypothetical protein
MSTDFRYVYDTDDVKSRLPVEYVAAHYDVLFNDEARALCPFHDDRENPNLELMEPGEDGYEWVYCRACGYAGDVIHLVRGIEDLSFYDALVRCSDLLDDMPADVTPPKLRKRRKFVVTDAWERRLEECQSRARQHSDIGLLSFAYGFTDETTNDCERRTWDEWLIRWGWGLDDAANVIIPHRNADGRLTTVKVRYRDGGWRAFGEFVDLYGAWWDGSERRGVLICEGESDCVWAAKQATGLQCLALPSGADSYDERWVQELCWGYPEIFLAFDGDGPGKRATWRWQRGFNENGREARVLPVAKDKDLRTDGRSVGQLLDEAGPEHVLHMEDE